MENLHLLFNKSFYDKLTFTDKGLVIPDISEKSQRLYNALFHEKDYQESELSTMENYTSFLMKTTYPGALIGSGNIHGVSVEEDTKIGFTFDYVTGQPYIPATSVKGVIKAYLSKPKIFRELSGLEIDDKLIKDIIIDIFEEDKKNRDIFLDAVIRHGDESGKILGKDFITPHSSPVKDPNPIQFVKILPDVVFEFRFILTDTVVGDVTITAEKKKEMFMAVISDFGVGAKTNVGYGQLVAV